MNFKFDLQMFAALDFSGGVTAIVGNNVTTLLAGSTLYVGSDGKAYQTTALLEAATNPTVSQIGTIVLGATDVTVANKIKNTDVKSLTLTSQAKVTFDTNDEITADSLTWDSASGITAFTNLVYAKSGTGNYVNKFAGASGDVTGAAGKGSYTLSNFTGNIKGDDNTITNVTSGTVTTKTDFDGSFMGTAVTTANVLGLDSTGNNTVYTITAITSGQTYTTPGDTTSWHIVGSNGEDIFATTANANGTGAVTLDGGASKDTFTLNAANNVSINGGDGGDIVNIKAAILSDSTIIGGAGDDLVDFTGAVVAGKNLYVDLGDGHDTVQGTAIGGLNSNTTILGGAGKDVINLGNLTAAAAKAVELYVEGGADADEITGNTTKITNSTVVGGDGNDTIGGFDKSVTLEGGSGSDYFKLGAAVGGTANIKDYTFGEDYLVVDSANAADEARTLATTAANLKSDGELGLVGAATSGAATITSSAGFYAATLVNNANTDKVNVAWVGGSPVTIDGSSQNIASVITGRTNSEADLLIGGSKADTIYAAAGDSVYGGTGSDNIVLTDGKYGEYVGLSTASGADSVTGFNAGWDIEKADALYMMDGTAEGLKLGITGNDVTLKSGSATMSIKSAAGATDTNLLINDKKVDLITKGKTITVTDDSTIADYYIGTENAGISLKNYTGDLEVNLSNEMFRNITTLEGGAGSTSILGGKAAESLKGGTGDSSLYGGAGVDTLVSGDGKTTFFATAESGRDVVTGFVAGADDSSDVLNVSSIAGVKRTSGTNFTVNVDNSNSLKVTQKSGNVNSNIQWVSGEASGVAKIGTTDSNNTFSYDTDTTNYIGGNKVDTVSLTSGTTDNFNVWLDQTGGMFNSIEVYDLKNTSGDVLMAGKADTKETIIGGKSNTSLWGGVGNTADVLKSTSGSTTNFFYGLGDGNDSISGSANDAVNLYNINLGDITKADINSGSVVFTTTANNTVTVSGSVGTFKLADGTAWTANYSSKTWSEAQ